MTFLSLGIGCSLAVFILTKVISIVIAKRRCQAEAARQGCKPAPAIPNLGFLGLTRILDYLKATREERGPPQFVDAMNELGTNGEVHTARVQVLGSEVLVTRDPENVKAIYATNASSFEIGASRAGCFEPLLGLGIFTQRGEPWRHSRALLRPQFSREQISDMDLEERHVNALSAVLKTGTDGWTDVVDLQPMFLKMTLELMTEFLYGHLPLQIGQKTDAPDREEFGYHFDAGKGYLGTRLALGKWHWLVNSQAFARHCEKVHQYADYFVTAKLQLGPKKPAMKMEPQEPATKGKFVLLDELAKHTDNALEIRSETLNVLSAGRDTTASLLSWIFYFLSRHPRVFDRLRTVVLAEVGTDASSIEFTKLRSCHYLQHCINEALRMTGIVPTMERESLEDTVLPRGGGPDGTSPVFLPKGQRVMISIYAMQQRPDIWGDDPGVFRPERWEDRKTGFEFIPFGGGPRKCVGQQMALTEASYTVVRLLQRFDKLENCEPPGRIRFQHTLSIRSGTGAVVRLHEAAKAG
ncbi:MAG: hypothetical protein ASARMPREDX12_006293 [Alectoria sarmentosa]|nr:MAG: hypothetical protein ASARMPREDX12_006293 [Alectoria sarmentosa]